MAIKTGGDFFPGNGNWTGPIDNVQRFEQLTEDARFVQMLADFGEDPEYIDAMSNLLVPDELIGLPVRIQGGKIQVPAIESDPETISSLNTFADNDWGVEGEYCGMAWRVDGKAKSDDMFAWYLCHVVHTDTFVYIDEDTGKRIQEENRSFVSAVNSCVEVCGNEGAHDFRALSEDGFALKIDQLALDEDMTYEEKIQLVRRMIGVIESLNPSADARRKIMLQRISYINHIGLFKGRLCTSSFAYRRLDDEVNLVTNTSGVITGHVQSLNFDFPLALDEDESGEPKYVLDSSEEILCIEAISKKHGNISIPVTEATSIFGK